MIRIGFWSAAVIALVMWAVCCCVSSSVFAQAFDKPIRKTVLKLGRSPNQMANNRSQIELSCYYYPNFLIRQLFEPDAKGTLWVAISPISNGELPPCSRARHVAEKRLTGGSFFLGVKASLLFLEDADGLNGMPFSVIDLRSNRKVFEDSALGKVAGKTSRLFEFVEPSAGAVSIRYVRVVEGNCSLPKDGEACWKRLRRQYGLAATPVPKCSGYIEPGHKPSAAGDDGVPSEDIKWPSVIAYEVDQQLLPSTPRRTLPGRVKCFAPE